MDLGSLTRVCRAFFVALVMAAALTTTSSPLRAEAPVVKQVPARPAEQIMVPDRFLRRWDPVTIFFDEPTGPGHGKVVTGAPEQVARTPDHPGQYKWLDERTLQFRPAEPWPPLERFTWRVGAREQQLATLMAPATKTSPADGASDLKPVERMTLTFAMPLPPQALRRMARIEVRDYPGIEDRVVRTLDSDDMEVKALERRNRDAPARYRLRFDEPIAAGRQARLRLRLSLDDSAEQAFQTVRFSTRRPFRPVAMGCPDVTREATTGGSKYSPEDVLTCDAGRRRVVVTFSAPLGDVGPIAGRNLVRFEPAVEDLQYRADGERLVIDGGFEPGTRYRMRVVPGELEDSDGRPLTAEGVNALSLAFPPQPDFMEVNGGSGRAVMERHGPQTLPLEGRGEGRVDLRIHRIEPGDLSHWPYSDQPVTVDESQRPNGPGEGPDAPDRLRRDEHDLSQRIRDLGSPAVSRLVELPLDNEGSAARFGLDLEPYLERIGGADTGGTYLVGIRQLGETSQRHWVRVQVTDLALSVVEAESRVKFVVTSLDTGEPVRDAVVQVDAKTDGDDGALLRTVARGSTDGDGMYGWDPPGSIREGRTVPERIRVRHDDDSLVVDVREDPPKQYQDNRFRDARGWLEWTLADDGERAREPAAWRCHVFTERPVYRPDEPVHIKGYWRRLENGRIDMPAIDEIRLLVKGSSGNEWRYDLSETSAGGFYHKFDEETDATGEYRIQASIETVDDEVHDCGAVTVEKTNYRIPKFEARLSGPEVTGLDRPFELELAAEYYAGGMVTGRPVRWRVTQFPYRWTPAKREGFFYSTDSRFSGMHEFESRSTLRREAKTDDNGMASLRIDPSREPSAQPRRYVVEATVVGARDETVTDTYEIEAVPPFALGLDVPRYLENADGLTGRLLAAGPDDELMAGKEVQLRLIKRDWAARLQAGDFTSGEPEYRTEQIDRTVLERTLETGESPSDFDLPLDETGVYIVEISARDKLGRRQSVRVDLFNDGEGRATWEEPPQRTFEVTTDQSSYAPGETAHLVLESPVAKGRALVVIEEPNGSNRYEWLEITGGKATYDLPVERRYTPSVPVHFVLMRGRLPASRTSEGGEVDLGKPMTMAATAEVSVEPVGHRLDVGLAHPEKAEPGDSIEVDVELTDNEGNPRDGRVALWLVDQAVLALGEEQPLDPLPTFIRQRDSHALVRDTRNRATGRIPFQQRPGGGEAASRKSGAGSVLDQVSVRKNFASVPVFKPAVRTGRDGKATVAIDLPDNVTNFMIRAKAATNGDRFGYGTGKLGVRLPVVVQPSLPRFVRYGDEWQLSALARVVDGPKGSARAELAVDGLTTEGATRQSFEWGDSAEHSLDFSVSVPMPDDWPVDPGQPPEARVSLGVERAADGAGDGVEKSLPVYPDRQPTVRRSRLAVDAEGVELPAIDDSVRDGSLRRRLLFADRREVVTVLAAVNQLLAYPHGNTEQRVSRARSLLAARGLIDLARPNASTQILDRYVRSTLDYLDQAINEDGYVGFWPGASEGRLVVTAWSYLFTVRAEEAGYDVDPGLAEDMRAALKRGLRGDYDDYVGEYTERSYALTALAASGHTDAAYAAELARRAEFLRTGAMARVLRVLSNTDSDGADELVDGLEKKLWNRLIFKRQDGVPVYAGIKREADPLSPVILPAETRTVAQALRAVDATPGHDERQDRLVDALVRLGGGDGWGNTNANAEATVALQSVLEGPGSAGSTLGLLIESPRGEPTRTTIGGDRSLRGIDLSDAGRRRLSAPDSAEDRDVTALETVRYVAEAPGSEVAASADGFAVSREMVRVNAGEDLDPEVSLDAGADVRFEAGRVVEDRVTVVNPEERHHVAVVVPLAAGMEPLNPTLETAPPTAEPSRDLTRKPTYRSFQDHRVAYYYDTLPKGTYEFAVRTRARVSGRFTQPAAYAELMYQPAVRGHGNGARIRIDRSE